MENMVDSATAVSQSAATSRFSFNPASVAGAFVVERVAAEDPRGSFTRMFCAEEFQRLGLNKKIVQINHSVTRRKGAVRGLHFQHPPHAETKIVSCLRGCVFDVMVDIRAGSTTFLEWHGEILSEENGRALVIPEGCAHGFQALEDDCELLYLHTDYFTSAAEGALNVRDPRLAIDWPLAITELSDRDRSHPLIDPDFSGVQP